MTGFEGRAARTAAACGLLAALSAASLAVGMVLMAGSGARSGAGLAAVERLQALQALQGWLVAAELLKLASVAAFALVLAGGQRRAPFVQAMGYAAVVALVLSGGLGLVAAVGLGGATNLAPLGLAAGLAGMAFVVLTGAWAGLSALRGGALPRLPPWLRATGMTMGGAGLAAVLLPPAAMLFGLFSLPWWGGLAVAFGRLARAGVPTKEGGGFAHRPRGGLAAEGVVGWVALGGGADRGEVVADAEDGDIELTE